MQDYELRILNFDGTLSLLSQNSYLNTLAAISASKRIAGTRPYEVWCDERCLYSSLNPPPITPPSSRPAA